MVAVYFTPRGALVPVVLCVAVVSVATIGALVGSPRTQFFVPTIFRGPGFAPSIALTFDDGPDPTYTPQILDRLRAADAKATFFVVGAAADRFPDLVRRIEAEGHLLASHTHSHAHTFHFWRARAMATDIQRGVESIERITGERPRYFRPPQGLRVPTLRDALEQMPSPPACVTWTARGIDTVARSPDAIVARLTKWLIPGAILTLHDGAGFGGRESRAATVAALEPLLVEAKVRGLACVRLDELLDARPEAAPAPLPSWRRGLRVLSITSVFAGFWTGATFLAWIALPLLALSVRDPVQRIRACQRVVSASFRFFHAYMRWMNLFEAAFVNDIPRAPRRPVVFVANHTTLVDVTAILSRLPHVCCMASSKYVDHPLFGRLLRLTGFIAAGHDVASHASALALATKRLEEGFDVLVFPEGTRSPPDGLLPFRRGAFEIACRAGAPVAPLVLRCKPSALTRDRPFWKQPDQMARLTIEARPWIEPGASSAALRTLVEDSYRKALELPRRVATAPPL